MESKKILAVVVTYFPDKELLEKNIQAYIDYVDHVLVWENTPEAEKLRFRYITNAKVEYCGDGINSISRALNYAWRYAQDKGFDYLLTMDQDSVFEDFEYYISRTVFCDDAPKGIWTPQINSQETGADYEEINTPITSGTLLSLNIVNMIGGWNEFFTIDSVDDEFFLKAHKCHIKKYRIKGVTLNQRYGSPQVVQRFGHTLVLRNDNPQRLYSIYRNKTMIMRQYPEVGYLKDDFFHYWPKVILLVLLFEKSKFRKISAIIRGMISGYTDKIQDLRHKIAKQNTTVRVLMSTYNGEHFLKEQLDSVLSQEGVAVNLLIRDDGSTDNTRNILADYAARYDNIQWIGSENVGFIRSFSKLVEMALADDHQFDFYAFSDQDDVWMPDKLSTACGELESHNQHMPLLFSSNSLFVDDNLHELGKFHKDLPYHTRQNIIIYPIAQGCSMMFNRKAMELYLQHPPKVSWHDRWMSLICNFFGETAYCYTPLFYYRIHGNNTIGKKKNFFGRILDDMKFYFSSDPKNSPVIEEFYDAYKADLSNEDLKAINTYLHYKESFRKKFTLMTSSKFQHTLNWWDVIRKALLVLFNRV